MSVERVAHALADVPNRVLTNHFMGAWTMIQSILLAFSQATDLPIFVHLNGKVVYTTESGTMPDFCQRMLASEEGHRCISDGQRRARGDEQEVAPGVQLCHAGMLNGRVEIDTDGLGPLVITYGSRKSMEAVALERRRAVIDALQTERPALAGDLTNAAETDPVGDPIQLHDQNLMAAIAEIIQQMLRTTVGFQNQSVNMAHELSNTLLMVGLMARTLDDAGTTLDPHAPGAPERVAATLSDFSDLLAEAQLGLYVVRNFLSHAGGTPLRAPGERSGFTRLDLPGIVEHMVRLHERLTPAKKLDIEAHGLDQLPRIYGDEMEIRRLLYNVLTNAIKYSYHSVPSAHRTIRVFPKVPYDPGFRSRRFALVVENYGMGVTEEERRKVFQSGFRGEQARREVPIGSGIGLSESAKIMNVHGGHVRLSSRLVHADTYLTTVELVFPFPSASNTRD